MSPRDAFLEAVSAPSAKLIATVMGVVGLGLGGAAGALLWAFNARADIDTVRAASVDHARRIEVLEKARINDSWNLYLVCSSQGRLDCRKPDGE